MWDWDSYPPRLENRLLSTKVCVSGHLLGRTGMCSSPSSASWCRKTDTGPFYYCSFVWGLNATIQAPLSKGPKLSSSSCCLADIFWIFNSRNSLLWIVCVRSSSFSLGYRWNCGFAPYLSRKTEIEKNKEWENRSLLWAAPGLFQIQENCLLETVTLPLTHTHTHLSEHNSLPAFPPCGWLLWSLFLLPASFPWTDGWKVASSCTRARTPPHVRRTLSFTPLPEPHNVQWMNFSQKSRRIFINPEPTHTQLLHRKTPSSHLNEANRNVKRKRGWPSQRVVGNG